MLDWFISRGEGAFVLVKETIIENNFVSKSVLLIRFD